MISMRPIAIPWLRNKLPNQLRNLDQDGVSADASSPDGYVQQALKSTEIEGDIAAGFRRLVKRG